MRKSFFFFFFSLQVLGFELDIGGIRWKFSAFLLQALSLTCTSYVFFLCCFPFFYIPLFLFLLTCRACGFDTLPLWMVLRWDGRYWVPAYPAYFLMSYFPLFFFIHDRYELHALPIITTSCTVDDLHFHSHHYLLRASGCARRSKGIYIRSKISYYTVCFVLI